ncbi:acyltransferase [Leucobacter allii]|uniref:acyltransferase family protein n=1 Tax=Leucobacter allii TaxID=2932247 RepID=UPI001FD2C286|nr:acyltransferase family protein [Leucobacter allii]UOR02243.1 acyltransferase [Leucobacter allii]
MPSTARERAPGSERTRRGTRLDIQGLRALAVALVVGYHLFPERLSGGYLGVDVFFVISGYLIIGHLLRELDRTGRIRIARFWARRVRRLIPAALLVLLVCAVLAVAVMPAIVRVQNLGDIGFAAGYLLNWHLAAGAVDYLDAANPPSLVQHYWSLSVEEQFYLVTPLLIAGAALLAARLRGDRRRLIATVLAAAFAASLIHSIALTAASPQEAYFVTTTRVWEFLLGGLVAMLPAARLPGAAKHALSLAALLAILAAAYGFDAATAFPGWIALIPVAATGALLWVGDSATGLAPQRLAHARPVQFVGDTSYAIYLWHWPLIVVLDATLGADPAAPLAHWRLALIVLPATLLLAWATRRFVEEPVRRARGPLERPPVVFGGMAVAAGLVIALCAAQILAAEADTDRRRAEIQALLDGDALGGAAAGEARCVGAGALVADCAAPHARTPAVDPAFAEADKPWYWFTDGDGRAYCTETTVGTWTERSCDVPAADPGPDAPGVVVLGDSHAEHVFAPIQRVAAERGWDLRLESRASCGLFARPAAGDDANAARCAEWGERLRGEIAADPEVDTVLVSLRTELYDLPAEAAEGLAELRDAGKRVVVIRDVPVVGVRGPDGAPLTGPECVLASGQGDDPCTWTNPWPEDWLIETAVALGLDIVDTYGIMCPEETCHMVTGDLVMYTDDNHLTGMFSLSLAPWFAKTLAPIVD